MISDESGHSPVMVEDVLRICREKQGGVEAIFDGTFGRGGHSRVLLDAFPRATLVALDWDDEAITFGERRFAAEVRAGRMKFYRGGFQDWIDSQSRTTESNLPRQFDLMLLDLGVSSPQLDDAQRGFSFYQDGPLDMRMDRRQSATAADIVNTWSELELVRVFQERGEVRRPHRVVRAIVHDRRSVPFASTRQLAGLIERVEGWKKRGSHPATRYFLGLRLQVNEELAALSMALPELMKLLSFSGRIVVITFHSLEDRIVKNIFRSQTHLGRVLTKKVIKPRDEEVLGNPRARSAKLRAFEAHHRCAVDPKGEEIV